MTDRLFNEITLREDIHKTWGEHGAHADVYGELLKRAAKAEALDSITTELLHVLDDVDACVRAADMERLTFIAFVWSQRQDHIVSGKESWADQNIPPVVLGGAISISDRRKDMLREAG